MVILKIHKWRQVKRSNERAMSSRVQARTVSIEAYKIADSLAQEIGLEYGTVTLVVNAGKVLRIRHEHDSVREKERRKGIE